ncbi:unnamed protein product [Peniophora sp. CBMAI 1063]|nr:unnamed protein product [Peniophora sp. CBMAI 1063]
MFFLWALQLTPDGHLRNMVQLDWLGYYIHRLYLRSRIKQQLQCSIYAFQSAVVFSPSDDPQLPRRLSNLAISFHSRFNRFGDTSDLESSLDANRRAVDLTPKNDPELPRRLSKLAVSFHSRYERFGDTSDLESSLDADRRAVDLTPKDDPQLPLRLSNLAISFHSRDLESALETNRRAVELTPTDDPELPRRLSILAVSFRSRFGRFGDPRDLESALDADRRAVELTPADDPDLPLRLSNLAISFHSRFNRFGDSRDLESALETDRRAVELTPTDDPELPRRLSNLAVSFGSRYEYSRDGNDLNSALKASRSAVELTPDGHPDKIVHIQHLARCCASRVIQHRTQEDFDEAISFYQTALDQPVASPQERFNCAEEHLHLLAENPHFCTLVALLSAHSRVVDALPELVWLGHSVQRRFEDSADVGELVNSAVSVAIENRQLDMAVGWLEAGRSLIWSQISSLQSPMDDLEKCHPDTAKELREARQRLQQLGTAAQIGMHAPTAVVRRPAHSDPTTPSHYVLPIETASDHYQRAAIAYDALLKKIRSLDGFQDFMRPSKLADLVAAPAFRRLSATAVVFINVAKTSCDALVLSKNGSVKLVQLPALSQKRAEKLRSLWTEHVGLRRGHRRGETSRADARNIRTYSNIYVRILSRLWSLVVLPILSALDLITKPTGVPSSHIVWCPTGPLTQLPLHAAGNYDQKQPRLRVFNFVMSSYTPSLSALLRCLGKDMPAALPSILVVAQSYTPRLGSAPLPCVRDETARLRAIMPGEGHKFLEDEQASVEHTLAAIKQHSWVHFACHGSQNTEDPTLTAIELHNKSLTLGTLIHNVSVENAELAFLSACETAVGDEEIPEESAHLAAGMLAVGFKGVVATMWSIQDMDAPIIVEAFYKKLLELRASGDLPLGHTGAARALHHATMVLKDKVGENNFERWVPFVHFGV